MPQTFTGEGWIPIETFPEVQQAIMNASAVETFGSGVPMGSNIKEIPRSGGVHLTAMGKGQTYSKDTSANDSITIFSSKIGGIVEVDYEDLQDSLVDIFTTKTKDAGTSYGKLYDNFCLGITAAKGSVTLADGTHPGFDSLYYLLTQAETETGYVANSNLTHTTTAGLSFDKISDSLALLEDSDWYDPADVILMAHPRLRGRIRKIKDGDGRPIFFGSRGEGDTGQGNVDTVLEAPVHWTRGAATSGVPSDTPAGAPFMVWAMRSLIRKGDREQLHALTQSADEGAGFDSDVAKIKFRSRKGFVPGAMPGFSMLVDDKTASS
jgi:HK97 family phage major capsid protein